MATPTMTSGQKLRETASEFLRLAASGQVREAYARFVAPNFRHHNAYFKGDAESLMKGMEENAAQNPDKTCDIKQALQEGDRVALLTHIRHNPKELGYAVVHIFRFEGDKIAELWDVGQPIPEESKNDLGMF